MLTVTIKNFSVLQVCISMYCKYKIVEPLYCIVGMQDTGEFVSRHKLLKIILCIIINNRPSFVFNAENMVNNPEPELLKRWSNIDPRGHAGRTLVHDFSPLEPRRVSPLSNPKHLYFVNCISVFDMNSSLANPTIKKIEKIKKTLRYVQVYSTCLGS